VLVHDHTVCVIRSGHERQAHGATVVMVLKWVVVRDFEHVLGLYVEQSDARFHMCVFDRVDVRGGGVVHVQELFLAHGVDIGMRGVRAQAVVQHGRTGLELVFPAGRQIQHAKAQRHPM